MDSIWILGDQLGPANSALAGADRRRDAVVMVESRARGGWLRYHKQKLVLVYSAMRHFAEELRADGWRVDYRSLDETATFEEGLQAHLSEFRPDRLVLAEPNDFPMTDALPKLARRLDARIETVPTRQFLCGRDEFRRWAGNSPRLLMENHYRRMRAKTGYLMESDGSPAGGRWNFDAENRKTFSDWEKAGRPRPGAPPRETPDATTRAVMAAVEKHFPDHPGSAEGFWLPVTRAAALRWLGRFVDERLSGFGPFEDIMVSGEPTLFHSVLSPALNIGLLTPAECCEAALAAHEEGRAPLSSVEGFIRQIIGWREFINGVYWLKMPGYTSLNALGADRPLPRFFRDGGTDMRCLGEVLAQVEGTAFNHHIQRLMVLGNFFLLAGVRPAEALRWYLEMYADAFDWVMAANVIGMVLHADGGFMATKPYAAGSGYIAKMSDYCRGCRFNPRLKTGPDACPFNYLYWAFYDRHAARFARNPRTAMAVNTWKRKPESEKRAIRESAGRFLAAL